jgi:hypothetical protein
MDVITLSVLSASITGEQNLKINVQPAEKSLVKLRTKMKKGSILNFLSSS